MKKVIAHLVTQNQTVVSSLLQRAFEERFPELEARVVEGEENEVVVSLRIIAMTDGDAKRKAGYYLARAAARTRVIRYTGAFSHPMEVEPWPAS